MEPLEALYADKLPNSLIADAALDVANGAPALRRYVWGINRPSARHPRKRRVQFAHYRPPLGLYLECRLTVRTPWRNRTVPFTPEEIRAALGQLDGWIRANGGRLPTIGFQQAPQVVVHDAVLDQPLA